MSHLNNSDSLFQRIIADVLSDVQWCIAKNGGGYTQRGVAKGLKVPCLFMITEVSIRCQKNPEVGIRRSLYPRIPPNTPLPMLRFPVFLVTFGRNVRRILVRGSMPPCRPRRRKFRKFDYEMVHSEVYLNKKRGQHSAVFYTCLP